jgi:hypothetical protein
MWAGVAAPARRHVAGHSGGQEPIFRLSRPRYNAVRRTVSYRARPLNNKRLPGRLVDAAAAGAARGFGEASLSVVPHPTVASGDYGGNDCSLGFANGTDYGVKSVSYTKWDTDTWDNSPDIEVGNIKTAGRRDNSGGRHRMGLDEAALDLVHGHESALHLHMERPVLPPRRHPGSGAPTRLISRAMRNSR